MKKIIISNGHDKFILAPLAAELSNKKLLCKFITGAYPGRLGKKIIPKLPFSNKALERFLKREESGILVETIHSKPVSEAVSQVSALLRRVCKLTELADQVLTWSMRIYAFSSEFTIRRSNAGIYHYRSGYGLSSVAVAKLKGMVTICDHSIANPEVLEALIQGSGQWPKTKSERLGALWRIVLSDLKQADYIIVNSSFVKESFTRYGWDENRIFINYTGIDDVFLRGVPRRERRTEGSVIKFLFAGELSKRKGAETIFGMIKAVDNIDFKIEIIGAIDPDMTLVLKELRLDNRIQWSGFLSRGELAVRMSNSDVFIFPSLAEGSARVVFMAMACGCYVVTTPNSGTIVENAVHGRLIPPGDIPQLVEAVSWCIGHPSEVFLVGEQNSLLIKQSYTQSTYGENTVKIYQKIMGLKTSDLN